MWYALASATAAAYAARIQRQGAWHEVPAGFSLRSSVSCRCLYCRRTYSGTTPRTCDGCGASEYERHGFEEVGSALRDFAALLEEER